MQKHGIFCPLFSLRSQKSCGIGEFLDLFFLIDFCHEIGFDILQISPLNDTGPNDSPFSPISSCALDPIYLSLHALPDPPLPLTPFVPFNKLTRLDRNAVREQKISWLQSYFATHFPTLSKENSYHQFLSQNPWLFPYATFKAEHEPQGVDFHLFLQYLSFSQMKEVRAKADKANIFLKGDLPFLLPLLSADLSMYPHLFRLDQVAGAPPDKYNQNGQKWGFPIYDFEAMRSDGFSWWKKRLEVFENFYHFYRIDHTLGFFRIWAIPPDKEPQEGSFIPEDPTLWPLQGKEILSKLLSFSSLKPIAENLGANAQQVTSQTLKSLGIPGTRVLRWERYDEVGEYIPYHLYDPLSMTTVSTIDLEPVPLWWKNSPQEAFAFAKFKGWEFTPTLSREKHLEILRDSHHTSSQYHINSLQEYLLIFPELSWPNLEEEQINRAGTISPTNWTYRFRPFVEEIVEHASLKEALINLR